MKLKNLDASIKTCFTQHVSHLEILTANEKLLTKGFSQKRLDHFISGRYCAKKALSEVVNGDYEILKGKDGEPVWPEGFIGSISHIDGFYGAVAAQQKCIRSVGMDIEGLGKITNEMRTNLFTQNELEFIGSMDFGEQDYYSTLFFSLKESFYKMQFPMTGEKLWFTDLEIGAGNSEYQICVLKEFDNKKFIPLSIGFCFEKQDGCVISLCIAN